MSHNKKIFKVIILGDEGVGKTSTLLRYENQFRFECPLSLGLERKKSGEKGYNI